MDERHAVYIDGRLFVPEIKANALTAPRASKKTKNGAAAKVAQLEESGSEKENRSEGREKRRREAAAKGKRK